MRLPWLAQSEQKVRFAFSICRFWLEKAVALGAVIGTNLHGEGSRALSKRTAISFSSPFALGWGHLWALMKIWTTPPFYRKKICPDLMFHTNQMKMHLLFSVCFGVVFFSVRVFHCMSVWQGGCLFLFGFFEGLDFCQWIISCLRLDFGPCLQEGGGISPKKVGTHEAPLRGLTQRLPKHQPFTSKLH